LDWVKSILYEDGSLIGVMLNGGIKMLIGQSNKYSSSLVTATLLAFIWLMEEHHLDSGLELTSIKFTSQT